MELGSDSPPSFIADHCQKSKPLQMIHCRLPNPPPIYYTQLFDPLLLLQSIPLFYDNMTILTKGRGPLCSLFKPRRFYSSTISLDTSTSFLDGVLQHVHGEIPYDKTIKNLRISRSTKIIYQGFTGAAATANARATIDWGTQVVGGVSPKKGGTQHLGLPVFATVSEAMKAVKPDATAVFVPARLCAGAIEEAIEAEIPLIVSVTEHVPLHDLMRVQQILRTQSRSRLVGPNCPGIINPAARCRIGIMPHKRFLGGSVGIVSKSGTVSYEAVGATSEAGLGQSLVIGMGGDMMPGTTFVDALKVFIDDRHTKGIAMFGEIGGDAEFEAAELLSEYCQRPDAKPVCGLVTGVTAPRGKMMGHSGAVLMPGDRSAEEKMQAWKNAGVEILDHPAMVGKVMRRRMTERGIIQEGELTVNI